ncbi:hypothetical protein [Salsuginibacillus kocurii]|uniref:hypothetical protein n=1 Tax=Salsuginibacillus kocurii TaxID=427078 RepID=UPI000378599C|nr:hypothetical protein [Salsuginibacillus kocurii]
MFHQYILHVENVYRPGGDDRLNMLIAEVEAEVIDGKNGDTLYELTVPVTFHAYGVYPDIKAIGQIIPEQKVKRELFFQVRRYVRKLRNVLVPEEDE